MIFWHFSMVFQWFSGCGSIGFNSLQWSGTIGRTHAMVSIHALVISFPYLRHFWLSLKTSDKLKESPKTFEGLQNGSELRSP